VIVSIGSVAAATGAAAATGSFSASLDSCPNGFQLFSVAGLEALGPYGLPRIVDNLGNKNGNVCGNEMPPAVATKRCKLEGPGSDSCGLLQSGLPVYNFTDDDVPGQTPRFRSPPGQLEGSTIDALNVTRFRPTLQQRQ
jgi:hypothetical protein